MKVIHFAPGEDRTITLTYSGASIDFSVWDIPAPLVSGAEGVSGESVTVNISGGVEGEAYLVSNTAVLTSGRIRSQSVLVMFARRTDESV